MMTRKINRKLAITSLGVLILVVVVGMGVYLWQHDKVNSLNQQLKAQKSMYSKLQSSNSSLQQENKSLSGKLNGVNQSLSSATKIYHVGDTQDGVTLVGVYHGSELHQMGASPYTNYDVFFALRGVSQDDAMKSSAILTTSGQYFGPNSTQQATSQCGNNGCAGFLIGNSVSSTSYTPKEFLYNGLQWQL